MSELVSVAGRRISAHSRDTAKPCEGIERILSLTGVERVLAGSGEQPPPSLVEKAATAISNAGQVAKRGPRRLRHMSKLAVE